MTHGNINLCDAGIFMAALLFGRRDGLIVGGLSGFILDLISGYSQYMFFFINRPWIRRLYCRMVGISC